MHWVGTRNLRGKVLLFVLLVGKVITWGLTAKEQTVEQYRPGDGTLLKIKREKLWPMEIIKALTFDSTKQSPPAATPKGMRLKTHA
eukprot:3324114-Amphidinium_carterae.1